MELRGQHKWICVALLLCVTQELLPLSSSLQRGSQEVRGGVRKLSSLPVGVDGSLKHVVTAQLLGHVVLGLHTETRHCCCVSAAVSARLDAGLTEYLGFPVASAGALRVLLHQPLKHFQRLLHLPLTQRDEQADYTISSTVLNICVK